VFIVVGGRHGSGETKRRTGGFYRIAILHVKIGKNRSGVLFLVDHEDAAVSPSPDTTPKKPLCVTTVHESKFLVEF
jgi:hypothetical protein